MNRGNIVKFRHCFLKYIWLFVTLTKMTLKSSPGVSLSLHIKEGHDPGGTHHLSHEGVCELPVENIEYRTYFSDKPRNYLQISVHFTVSCKKIKVGNGDVD